jgi:hypothetical protein
MEVEDEFLQFKALSRQSGGPFPAANAYAVLRSGREGKNSHRGHTDYGNESQNHVVLTGKGPIIKNIKPFH